jgi:hypothetical protein
MPVPIRRLLFVPLALVILGGCTKTQPAASDSHATAKKTQLPQLKQQAAKGSKGDPTDPGANSANAHPNGDPKPDAESTTRPTWPQSMGEFSAKSKDGIPSFPLELTGYRSEKGKAYEGKPYATRGSISVDRGSEWKGLKHFPRTRHGCSAGVFMLRWRLSDPVIRVYSTIDNPRKSTANVATGSFGYMYGSVCDKPQFKFASARKPNWSNLVDIYYELKFWEATP